MYELVSLNDVPSEAKEDQLAKKTGNFENNQEVEVEEKENDKKDDSSSSPVDGDSAKSAEAVEEEIAAGETNGEIIEKIEMIGDDKSDSIIIVEKDPGENGKDGFSLAEESGERRITRGYLNTEVDGKDQDIELLKEDKANKSNILEDSDLNESEDDSSNTARVPDKSDEGKSGNDETSSKLNDSFKVDLRPSWMMKTDFGERN